MNYGKFFRLNLNESKVGDGLAVYDYIDLPDYSVEESVSPRYPVSMVISEDAIRFRLHYLSKPNDLLNDNSKSYESGADYIHVNEVILNLPIEANTPTHLSRAIKQAYNTPFPFVAKGKEIGSGHYMDRLLANRYGTGKENTTVQSAYKHLRETVDIDRSFSSIWLWELQRERGVYTLYETRREKVKESESSNEKESFKVIWVGFLRKLLLDFMFDLQHSDIFQNSSSYGKMYSCLFSDDFFSALMHKCEYYYYRGIIRDEVSKGHQADEHIKDLYAPLLLEAEKSWINDITNPNISKHFYHQENDFSEHISETDPEAHTEVFNLGNSWFVGAETEMRRVVFALPYVKGESGRKQSEYHICNSETLAEYLRIPSKNRVEINALRSRVSQWFLKRYAFRDVLRLHVFRNAHWLIFSVLCIALVGIFWWPNRIIESTFSDVWFNGSCMVVLILITLFIVELIRYLSYNPVNNTSERKKDRALLRAYRRLYAKRVSILSSILIGMLSFAILYYKHHWYSWIVLAVTGIVILVVYGNRVFSISNIHLFLPRLIASITTAWLTIAIGNELFITFFDAVPSPLACGVMSVIVLFFILYEINRLLPMMRVSDKLIRTAEMFIISYAIALVVGLFITSFTGERFLERSGYLSDYYKQNVVVDTTSMGKLVIDPDRALKNIDEQEELIYKYPSDKQRINALTELKQSKGEHERYVLIRTGPFFILRDFLIQFAFMAMFIGVFIQMILDERNSITEM